jgi:RNA polymerase sigma-70 factor (ECF subfamily)
MRTSRDWRVRPAQVNGLPGYIVYDTAGEPIQTVALRPAAAPGRISAIYVQRNPDKLRHLPRMEPLATPAPDRPAMPDPGADTPP